MTLLDLLPFLEGWEDSTEFEWSGTITKTARTIVERKVRHGWLQNFLIITDDAYGGIEVEYNKQKTGYSYPATSLLLGYDNHAPSTGICLREYNNTGPGTYGVYVTEITLWGYPFKGHTAIYAKLGASSAFSTATLTVGLALFEITDIATFKKSLKELYLELGLSTIQKGLERELRR